MIHKSTQILEVFFTHGARIDLTVLFHDLMYFLRTVNTKVVNDQISLSE